MNYTGLVSHYLRLPHFCSKNVFLTSLSFLPLFLSPALFQQAHTRSLGLQRHPAPVFLCISGPRLSSAVAMYLFSIAAVERTRLYDGLQRTVWVYFFPLSSIFCHSLWYFNNALVTLHSQVCNTLALAHSQPLHIQFSLPDVLLPVLAFHVSIYPTQQSSDFLFP